MTPAVSIFAPRWVVSDAPDVLDHIHDDAIHLALWQRARPDALAWLDRLDLDEIDDVQETLAATDFASAVPRLLLAAGYPDGEGTTALACQISAMGSRFAKVMAADAVRMRLEVVETDACRKFHMDHVPARLLMPLTEPGTQWIEADRGPDAPIHQLRAVDTGLFKGRIWADEPAILHRSPPIARTGVSRLLLVLDLPHKPATADETEPASFATD